MNDEILICCEHCDGEGRLLTSWGRALHPCPMCEGTGCEIIETTLVEFDDFEECWG